jgi:hypothetical protein
VLGGTDEATISFLSSSAIDFPTDHSELSSMLQHYTALATDNEFAPLIAG